MSLSWPQKILLFKLEGAYGVDPTPTGAANAVLAVDVRIRPMEGNDVDRDLDMPYMGAGGTIPAELHSKITFKVEFSPSGAAGTAPAWGPLLRACAVAETINAGVSVVYNPVSEGHESGTFYFQIGGTLHKIIGSRGNCKLMVTAQGIPYLEFEFTGLFETPAEAARPAVDLTAFQKPALASDANTPTFTINAIDVVARSVSLDLGNQVGNRLLIGNEEVLITDKKEVIETTIEAVPLTTLDPYALAAAQSAVPLQLVHGTAAGLIATLDVPGAQMQRPQGLENAQNVAEWPLRMVPLPVAGNDQWTLTLT